MFLTPKQTVHFTPLSTRRGVGGEAGWVDCEGFFFPNLFG